MSRLYFVIAVLFILSSGFSGYWYCKLTTTNHNNNIRQQHSSPKITTVPTSINLYFSIPSTGKVATILQRRGWKPTKKPSLASLIWVQNKNKLKTHVKNWKAKNKTIQQRINHFKSERELGHKGRLLHYLNAKYGINGYPYMQPSWRMWIPRERSNFLLTIKKEGMEKFHRRTFITKEAHKDNGAGISIVSSIKELDELLNTIKNKAKSKQYKHLIVQKYLTNPLLTLDQKKFDLRIYFLIASIDPLIVLYHDGYLRVALDAYNSNINDTNKRGHLTNAKIQKDHNMYVYNQQKESTRRPFSYLSLLFNRSRSTTTVDDIRCKIERALIKIVQAEKEVIVQDGKWCPKCFSLLGADFLIDDGNDENVENDGTENTGHNVWISEVQSGPGLPSTTKTTKQFFEKELLPNMIDIMEEINKKRELNVKLLYPLEKLGTFHAIIHEKKRNGNREPEKEEKVMNSCRKKNEVMGKEMSFRVQYRQGNDTTLQATGIVVLVFGLFCIAGANLIKKACSIVRRKKTFELI